MGSRIAKFSLYDGFKSVGEASEEDADPVPINTSDKTGWVMEDDVVDELEDDLSMSRGYFTINMRRALASSQPEHDTAIVADGSKCDYFYGGGYDDGSDDGVYSADKQGFVPNAACAAASAGNSASDGSMTLAAALAATTTVVSLLAF